MLIMAPVAFFRCLVFWGFLIAYGARCAQAGSAVHALAFCSCVAALTRTRTAHAPRTRAGLLVRAVVWWHKGDERAVHARLVPVTRRSTRLTLWLCGYAVRARRADATAGAVCAARRMRCVKRRARMRTCCRCICAESGTSGCIASLGSSK